MHLYLIDDEKMSVGHPLRGRVRRHFFLQFDHFWLKMIRH